MLDIRRLDHAALTVRDVERSVDFYRRLGFEVVLSIPRGTFVRFGDAVLALFAAEPGAEPGKGSSAVDRTRVAIQHLAFLVDDDSLERHQQTLETAGISTRGPIQHEINRSLYFEDPDGHQLELTHPTEPR